MDWRQARPVVVQEQQVSLAAAVYHLRQNRKDWRLEQQVPQAALVGCPCRKKIPVGQENCSAHLGQQVLSLAKHQDPAKGLFRDLELQEARLDQWVPGTMGVRLVPVLQVLAPVWRKLKYQVVRGLGFRFLKCPDLLLPVRAEKYRKFRHQNLKDLEYCLVERVVALPGTALEMAMVRLPGLVQVLDPGSRNPYSGSDLQDFHFRWLA
jgi:hypothetical protein